MARRWAEPGSRERPWGTVHGLLVRSRDFLSFYLGDFFVFLVLFFDRRTWAPWVAGRQHLVPGGRLVGESELELGVSLLVSLIVGERMFNVSAPPVPP